MGMLEFAQMLKLELDNATRVIAAEDSDRSFIGKCKGVDEDDYVATIIIKDLEWICHTATEGEQRGSPRLSCHQDRNRQMPESGASSQGTPSSLPFPIQRIE